MSVLPVIQKNSNFTRIIHVKNLTSNIKNMLKIGSDASYNHFLCLLKKPKLISFCFSQISKSNAFL